MSALRQEGLVAFIAQMRFNPDLAGWLGVEREAFLARSDEGRVVPAAKDVLGLVGSLPQFGHYGYELSACQIEYQTVPTQLARLGRVLDVLDARLRDRAALLGLQPVYREVGPSDMSFDVYPDETARYARIAKTLSSEALRAACRSAGTHLHIGMPDLETALRVYNRLAQVVAELVAMSDHSAGERMRLYRLVAPGCDPKTVASIDELYELALTQGYAGAHKLRDWWSLVRLTRYGTVEVRAFGNTESSDEVVSWVEYCLRVCAEVM